MSFLAYFDLMVIIEKLSPTIFIIFLYLKEQVMFHIPKLFKKHLPSSFHATIHLLKLADKRSSCRKGSVWNTDLDLNKLYNHDNN